MKLRNLKELYRYTVKKLIRAYRKSKELELIQNNMNKIEKKDILLFCCLRNEKERIPYFLDYYRKLGVKHFFFVDNDSEDGFLDYIQQQEDCTVFHTKASYKDSNFGMDWLNYLLNKYGHRHWCITCDPDELFVYPHCETRNLYELTEYMQSIGQKSLLTVMLDMYSEVPTSQAIYKEGDNPLDVCPYFDKKGYFQHQNYYHRGAVIYGGVRLRKVFASIPEKAPCINKIPLVFWKRKYVYQSSMHWLTSRRLNRMYKENTRELNITGALLHFKFFASLQDKAAEEERRKQHFAGGGEYKNYLKMSYHSSFMNEDITEKYLSSSQLLDLKLIHKSSWF